MDGFPKLEKQPLKFVLAEFRFSPVLKISEYIPQIQEELRKLYPLPDKKTEQTFQVEPRGIHVTSLERWSFISANKKNAIDITPERLVYVTSEYPRFEGFAEACRDALQVFIKIVEPSLIMRVGLRYSDLVTADNHEQFSDLVNEHVYVPSIVGKLGKAQQHSTDTFIETTEGILAIRSLYANGTFTCLQDVQTLPIAISDDTEPSERIILDFDHFWESKNESFEFDCNFAIEKLKALHLPAREAFWTLTTDYARNEKWA